MLGNKVTLRGRTPARVLPLDRQFKLLFFLNIYFRNAPAFHFVVMIINLGAYETSQLRVTVRISVALCHRLWSFTAVFRCVPRRAIVVAGRAAAVSLRLFGPALRGVRKGTLRWCSLSQFLREKGSHVVVWNFERTRGKIVNSSQGSLESVHPLVQIGQVTRQLGDCFQHSLKRSERARH